MIDFLSINVCPNKVLVLGEVGIVLFLLDVHFNFGNNATRFDDSVLHNLEAILEYLVCKSTCKSLLSCHRKRRKKDVGHTFVLLSIRAGSIRLFTQLTFLSNDDLIKASLIHLCLLYVIGTFVSVHQDLKIIQEPI